MTDTTVESLELVVDRRSRSVAAGKQHILSDLCVTISAGRVTWLVGESGAGKSALCDLFAGLSPAAARISGTLRMGQEPIRLSSLQGRRRLAKRRRAGQLAWAPQNPADTFAPHHRLRKWFGSRPGPVPDLADFGLEADMLQCFPRELSGGQISRLSLAAALQHEPELLVCDEPTAGLDPAHADAIIAILERHAASGHAVLAATHDLSALIRAATNHGTVAVIFAGHIVETCPLAVFLAGKAVNPYSRALAAAAPALGAMPLPFVSGFFERKYRPGDEILRLGPLSDPIARLDPGPVEPGSRRKRHADRKPRDRARHHTDRSA